MRPLLRDPLRDPRGHGAGLRQLQGAGVLLSGPRTSTDARSGGHIRAVVFDAGNTLVFIDPERFAAVLEEAGVRVDRERYREAEREARLALVRRLEGGDRGTEDGIWREFFTDLFRLSGVPEDLRDAVGRRLKAVHDETHLWTHVEKGTPSTLESLLEAGYRLAVVSNADGRVEALLRERGLRDFFEFVIDSHVFGVEKPDPRIFLAAVERLGVAAGDCLYVGDLYPVDVVGARRAGLRAVLLDPWDRYDVDVDRIPSVAHLPSYLEGWRTA